MLKKLLSFILVAAMLLAIRPPLAFESRAAEIVKSGSCGDNVTFTLYEDGLLLIEGTGDMGVHYIWNYTITRVVISDGVTSLGYGEFAGCTELISVTLPDSLTSIDEKAFYRCTNLTSITIPEGVTNIGSYAFAESGLTSFTIPDSVTSLGKMVFSNCKNLTSIKIPKSFTSIGDWVFAGCKATFFAIPNSVTSIGEHAFEACSELTSVLIPNSVTSIGKSAFEGCTSLTSVLIPNSVTSIGDRVFSYCTSLTSVTISNSISSISSNAFYCCKGLTSVIIPNGVINIGSNAFYGCTGLTSVTIPKSVTSIGKSAFEGCTDLTSVDYAGTEEQWKAININSGNDALKNATIHYEAEEPETPKDPALYLQVQYDDTVSYTNGVFFGIKGFISDAIEVYAELTNAVLVPEGESDGVIRDLTLSAAINDDTLSFKKDANIQTYSVTFDEILCGETACELLQLFPQANFSGEEKNVTVTLTLNAEGLETVTETCPIKIRKIPDDSVQEHLDFYKTNTAFRSSMKNEYGHNAALLASNKEYLWSSISTFNFDNYYKIVVADLITGMLQAQQFSLSNLIPEAVKNWKDNLKTLKDGLKTIINDDYLEEYGFSDIELPADLDAKLDTLLKSSKYTDQGLTNEKSLFQFLLKRIDSAEGQDKLRKVFSAADKTSQILGMIKFGKNIVEDCLDCVTKITLLETFYDADEEFKAVIRIVRDKASASGQTELVKAFDEYLCFDSTKDGTMLSYLPTILKTAEKITWDAIKSVLGKKLIGYIGTKTLAWVGTATYDGVALNTFAEFSTFSSAFTSAASGVMLGVELGLCLSDLLCNSDSKAKELAMAIHMGELSTLLVQTLADMDVELEKNRDAASLKKFEYAFLLHKSAQSYILEHLIGAMKAKRYSVLSALLGQHRSMQEDIEIILVDKKDIDKMTCHKDDENSSDLTEVIKLVYVHCPVDVLILDKNGKTALCIENDEITAQEDGILCVILDGEKYILLPGDTEYSIQITATDDGQMRYSVREYKETELQAVYENNEIPLRKDWVFTGNITDGAAENENSYDLQTNNVRIPVKKTGITTFTPGDVDNDGKVTASDARLALRRAVDLENYVEGSREYLACDVDLDGKVTASDARIILRVAVGLETL